MDDSFHKILHEKYGKIMKISGLPGGKNMVWVFDPDDIEKVSFTLTGYGLITTIKLMYECLKRVYMFRYSEMKDHGQSETYCRVPDITV